MDQYLETELKKAFSADASRIPADAELGLRALDYKPRARHLSRLTVGALGAAATAGTVVSVVALGGSPAFAGWTASPTQTAAAQTASTDTTCESQLAADPGPPGSVSPGGWNVITTDVRGPFTVEILQNGSSTATCFVGPSFTLVNWSSANGDSMSAAGSVQSGAPGAAGSNSISVGSTTSGDIAHMTLAHLNSTADGPYTLAEGQLQSDVTGVTLVRSDGVDVEASLGGGWFVAWWPGSQSVTSAEITTASGVSTEPVNLAPLGSAPGIGSGTCSGSSQSSSSGPCTSGTGAAGPSISPAG